MSARLRNNIFLYLFLGWIIAQLWILWMPKGSAEWIVNQHWTPFLDQFFKEFTEVGSGIVFIPVVILAWLIDRKLVLVVVGTFLLMTLFAQGLKNIIGSMPRPAAFFEGSAGLHLAAGVDHHCCRSFPSGHTASAFSVFSLLALLIRNHRSGTIFLFVLASLAGFSRVYLLQHFFIDVVVGATLGVLATYLCYGFFLRLYLSRKWSLKGEHHPSRWIPVPVLKWKEFWF